MDTQEKQILKKLYTKNKLKELNNKNRIQIPKSNQIIESKKYKQKYKPNYNDQTYFFIYI